MSQYITDTTLNASRALVTPSLTDTAQRMVYTENAGDYGYGHTHTPGSTFACLFVPTKQQEALAEGQVQDVDAELIFGRGVTLTNHDRVKITKLHGDVQASPQTFEIVKGPLIDHFSQRASLRLVTDGSD